MREFRMPKFSSFEIFLLSGIIFIVAIVGIIALVSPPNNWDSMVYHMPRVLHWIQDHSVKFYPTHILRQLHLTPGAEFIILNLQILNRGDYFANLVQWFSMVGSIIGVSLITMELGGDLQTQILASVFCVTIPMGILQGSSTQNDYVVSFWLISFVYFILILNKNQGKYGSIETGISLGLAVLTKATAYIVAFPFLFLFVVRFLSKTFSRASIENVLKIVAIIGIVVVIINAGQYARNFQLFGSPLGPVAEGNGNRYKYTNDAFTLPLFTLNVIRNIALNTETPFNSINTIEEKGIEFFSSLLKVTINDPRITWTGTQFEVSKLTTHEDSAGNPVHFILIVISVVLFLLSKRSRASKGILIYSSAVICGFLLLCLILKWMPWNSRIMLPLFVLSAPFVAIAFSNTINNHRIIINLVAVLLLFSALPWVFHNSIKPIIGNDDIVRINKSFAKKIGIERHSLSIFEINRFDQYFASDRMLEIPYTETAHHLMEQKCSQVGLVTGINDPEYLFWVAFKKYKVRIEHVRVKNVSSIEGSNPTFDNFKPCALVSLNVDDKTGPIHIITH